MATPADQRLLELLGKWLTSLELHAKYCSLDDSSYARVQPWQEHQRPSRWIVDLAKQKTLALLSQVEERVAAGDATFSESLELMTFLANLVGSAHIQRFIPLAQPANERPLGLEPAEQDPVVWDAETTGTHEMPHPSGTAHESWGIGNRHGEGPPQAPNFPGNRRQQGELLTGEVGASHNGGGVRSERQAAPVNLPGNGSLRDEPQRSVVRPANAGSNSEHQAPVADPRGNGTAQQRERQGAAAKFANGGPHDERQAHAADLAANGSQHGDRLRPEGKPSHNGGGVRSEGQTPVTGPPGNGAFNPSERQRPAAKLTNGAPGSDLPPHPAHLPGSSQTGERQPSVSKLGNGSPRDEPHPPVPTAAKGGPNAEPRAVAKSAASPPYNRSAPSAAAREQVIADAARLVQRGRRWYELAELIATMADRPHLIDVRRILKDNKAVIELKAGRT